MSCKFPVCFVQSGVGSYHNSCTGIASGKKEGGFRGTRTLFPDASLLLFVDGLTKNIFHVSGAEKLNLSCWPITALEIPGITAPHMRANYIAL